MRTILAIAVALVTALPAAAQTAGDRYGPRRADAATRQAPFEGRTLAWANKTLASEAPTTAQIDNRPQPMALAAQYMGGQAQPQPQPPTAYQPFQPQIPLPAQMQQRMPVGVVARPAPSQTAAAAPTLPASIYGATTTAPAPADPVLAGVPPAQPQQLAAATPQAARSVGGAPRFYSLHRGYGLEPDAIPEPPPGNRYVLVGPSDDGGVESRVKNDNDDPDSRPGAF
jgi:hypothetical protein